MTAESGPNPRFKRLEERLDHLQGMLATAPSADDPEAIYQVVREQASTIMGTASTGSPAAQRAEQLIIDASSNSNTYLTS